ncbi:MAG: T9SS type A sorting domain-containing protein [Bacteroidota bacterium]
MKIFTLSKRGFAVAIVSILSLFLTQNTKACVDYHLNVRFICHYDDPNYQNISLTVTNLQLAGGSPNEFCSCGITGYTSMWSNIQYVAFVDSGTTNTIPGFDVWTPDANANNAWDNVLSTGNWNAFVQDVNTTLAPGTPVELIIRASLPPGYTFSVIDSSISNTAVGTDEWDNTNQTLANSHQSITWGWSQQTTYFAEGAGSTYFSDLDAALLVSVADQLKPQFDLYPVPAVDQLYVKLGNVELQLRSAKVFSATGQLVAELNAQDFESGLARLDLSAYPQGIYFLRLDTENGTETKKFSKVD